MVDFTFIVLARAVHVAAGVAWAGGTFVLAGVVLPLMREHGAQGAGRWLGMVARRAGMASIFSALATVATGIYLFAVLHPDDSSASGLVLKAGAIAALLALGAGLLIGRPAGMKLAQLQAAAAAGGAAPDAARLASLQLRSTVASRAGAGLLALSVVAMGVFRYAGALAG